MKKIITHTLLAAGITFMSGCGQDAAENTTQGSTAKQTALSDVRDYKLEHQASLVRKLPEKTVAYFRVPNLMGMISGPQGDALYPALSSTQLQQQSTLIAKGLQDNLISKIEQAMVRDLANLFTEKQLAPLEVAMLAGIGGALTPEVLLKTKLNITGNDELNATLEQLITAGQGAVQVSEAPDDNGNFRLAAGPVSVFGYFDTANKDFVLYGGMTVIESNLEKLRAGTLETRTDLYEFEQTFDSAGAGFATWADTSTILQQLSPMIPPEYKPMVETLNLKQSEFVYLGTAAKNGHGSLRIHLQHKQDQVNMLHFASSSASKEAKIALPINYIASYPLPNQQYIEQISLIEKAVTGQTSSTDDFIEQASVWLKENHQVELKQLLSAFGASAALVKDQAGLWNSIPINDPAGFDALIKWSTQHLGATLETSTAEGLEISHYTLEGFTKQILAMNSDEVDTADIPEPLMQLLSGENLHIYWHTEGSNIIVAALPQVLLARKRHSSASSIEDWLQNRSLDWSGNALALVAESDDLPEDIYHLYLKGIQSVSDITGVKPNLINMPLAEDLGLPEQGRLGFGLNTGKYSTSLNFDYEQSPIDYLLAGNTMASVAVIGVLAAVAIPAYDDYTVRAKGTEAFVSASKIKLSVSEYYSEQGALPTGEFAKQLEVETDKAIIKYNPVTEAIEINYTSAIPKLEGAQLLLVPEISAGGYIEWNCENISASTQHIPSECR